MTCEAAEVFYRRGRWPGLRIRNRIVFVVWDRNRAQPATPYVQHKSRVLRIIGPPDELDAHDVEDLLHTQVQFSSVKSREWLENGFKVVELHFCSIYGQSRPARLYLRQFIVAHDMLIASASNMPEILVTMRLVVAKPLFNILAQYVDPKPLNISSE